MCRQGTSFRSATSQGSGRATLYTATSRECKANGGGLAENMRPDGFQCLCAHAFDGHLVEQSDVTLYEKT
jgi:hypothetical protein